MKYLLLIAACFAGIGHGLAQFGGEKADSLRPHASLSLQSHAGKLVKIHGEYPAVNIGNLTEFRALWQTMGNKPWQNEAGLPSAGFSIVHAQFGNQEILGQAIGCIPMMRFQKKMKESIFSMRAGLGIAWFNKPYDAVKNPRNLVIGSPFANMSMIAFEYQLRLNDYCSLLAGGSFTHCSGAHVAVPNIGANLPAFTLGIVCHPHKVEYLKIEKKPVRRLMPQTRIGLQTMLAWHEFPGTIRPADGPRYKTFGADLHLTHRKRIHGKWRLGIQAYYYEAYRNYIRSQELFGAQKDDADLATSLIVYGGYEWNYRHIGFFIEAGYSLYNPTLRALNNVWDLPKHGWLYQFTAQKTGYRYYPHAQDEGEHAKLFPYLQLAVKTNGGTADFFEVAIGCDIRTKREVKNVHLNE